MIRHRYNYLSCDRMSDLNNAADIAPNQTNTFIKIRGSIFTMPNVADTMNKGVHNHA